jgi:hypothetical protein
VGLALFERSITQRLIRIIKWSAGIIPWKPEDTKGIAIEVERRGEANHLIGTKK